MAQNVTIAGASYNDVPAINVPKTGGGTARFTDVSATTASASDVASGKIFFDSAGAQKTGTKTTGKNVQAYLGYDTVQVASYTATALSITVVKTGTYNISWMGWRQSNGGTNGSRLHVNGTQVGDTFTSYSLDTYVQHCELTNISLNQGDVCVVRARSRSTSYRVGVGCLIISEV